MSDRYVIAQLDAQMPMDCVCGITRRAFLQDSDQIASVHFLSITSEAARHYHKQLTEIYIIIEGSGYIELDEDVVPVKPWMAILIKPKCRHRAIGTMTLLNIVIPPFRTDDEWFD
jgi:mannose-6-phosphate isomerase-like protein (cupin superfamily)